jgi:hypothetical protein
VGWKRDWARSRASGKKKAALFWIPVGLLFALLAHWPWGLLLIPLFWGLAALLWWLAAAEERYMLRTYDKYGEDHPLTSWTALGKWLRGRIARRHG